MKKNTKKSQVAKRNSELSRPIYYGSLIWQLGWLIVLSILHFTWISQFFMIIFVIGAIGYSYSCAVELRTNRFIVKVGAFLLIGVLAYAATYYLYTLLIALAVLLHMR